MLFLAYVRHTLILPIPSRMHALTPQSVLTALFGGAEQGGIGAGVCPLLHNIGRYSDAPEDDDDDDDREGANGGYDRPYAATDSDSYYPHDGTPYGNHGQGTALPKLQCRSRQACVALVSWRLLNTLICACRRRARGGVER
jgi:hypothetical protein